MFSILFASFFMVAVWGVAVFNYMTHYRDKEAGWALLWMALATLCLFCYVNMVQYIAS